MFWEALLHAIQSLITLSSLVEDNIYYFVIFADIFCRDGHELVDHFAEEVNISSSIVSYP